ncbi:MAG: ExeA family protein [Planctomycetota bacterium]|jgi:type II secretory pathway predicted ATPase ExeA
MYESFYGFDQRPFLTAPTLDRYFPAASIEATYQTVMRAVQRGEGPVAIFGGAGLGKTMCCLRIAASIPRNFDVVTLTSAQVVTRRALLQSLLYELHLPCGDGSEGVLRLTLLERLQSAQENATEGIVLIVDEAQTLSVKLLDELRILTNIVHNGVPRLRLVLCGTLRLEETLTHPHMESLNQRLAARCYLAPLSHEESNRYVQYKIELCGQRWEEVITPDGLEAIYRAADGIPRLIDQVADQSLLVGAKEKIRPINATVVGYAWSLLQQLPNPWSDAIPSGTPSADTNSTELDEFQDDEDASVEFGSLEDLAPIEVTVRDRFEERTSTAASRLLAASSPRSELDVVPENLFFGFNGDAGDEFQIPIQSLRDYQTLSGIALGDLNHDTSAFQGVDNEPSNQFIDDSSDFVDYAPGSSNRFGQVAEPMTSDASLANAENDFRQIETQIEEEMRQLVSNLNAEAIRRHLESNPTTAGSMRDDRAIETQEDDLSSTDDLNRQMQDHIQAPFAPLEEISDTSPMDDRDIIAIAEDDTPVASSSGVPELSASKTSIHPYARLFSQNRNS